MVLNGSMTRSFNDAIPLPLRCALPRSRVKMATMKHMQFWVGLGILLIGGGIVGGEYFLVKWYPQHMETVKNETLVLTPYKNDSMGIEMQVAAGINEKIEPIFGGVKISSPRFWSTGPSLTITEKPNPDKSSEFTPQALAIWETDGATHRIWRYDFEHSRINDRDAVLIWQYKDHAMWITARFISPDHLVEANCTPGRADEALYLKACEESLRSIKVGGTPSSFPPPEGGMEILPSPPHGKH